MAFGPGKYDHLCTQVREAANARGVILVVFGGAQGPGMSAQLEAEDVPKIVSILRQVADDIEKAGLTL